MVAHTAVVPTGHSYEEFTASFPTWDWLDQSKASVTPMGPTECLLPYNSLQLHTRGLLWSIPPAPPPHTHTACLRTPPIQEKGSSDAFDPESMVNSPLGPSPGLFP